jgi:hypothetical protein
MIEVKFLSHHRKAKIAPNPRFPSGIDVDLSGGATPHCRTELAYPAECCGVWLVHCPDCGIDAIITTAGRTDDPRSVKLACHPNVLQ